MIEKTAYSVFGYAFAVLLLLLCSGSHAVGESTQAMSESEYHASRGLHLVRCNQLKGAESELRRAVQISPNNAAYLSDLGGVLGMEHKLKESAFYLERALKLDPNDIATRRNLASDEWQMGRLEGAKQDLMCILKAEPEDSLTVLLLGMVEDSLKEYATAVRLLQSVQSLVRQRPAATIALTSSYYHTQEMEKARQTLKNLLTPPLSTRSVYLGAQLAVEAGDYETAEQLFTSILSTYPDRTMLRYELARVQYEAGHINESEKTLLELIDAGYQTTDIYNLLSWCYQKQGESKEAVQALGQAINHVAGSESEYLHLTRVLLINKLFPAAEIAARRAVQLNPNSEEAYDLQGEAELDLGFYKDAVQSYSRAVHLDHLAAKANLGLAQAQWGSGLVPQAAATFEHGIKRFPNDPAQYTQYARMLFKLGEEGNPDADSRAVSLLKAAIAVDHSRAEPYLLLGKFLLTHGKVREALKNLDLAVNHDPSSPDIHYALWRAYRRLGQSQEASKEFAKYRSLRTDAQL